MNQARWRTIVFWCGLVPRIAALVAAAALCARPGRAAAPTVQRTVELQTDAGMFTGAVLGRDARTCWLLQRDGSIAAVRLADVEAFRAVPEAFRPLTMSQFKTQLMRTYGRSFVWRTTSRFVVGVQHASRSHPEQYAELLEDVYRRFAMHWSLRGLSLRAPEFPLGVVVFRDRGDFDEHCRRDGVTPDPLLYGYYHRVHNRIIAFAAPEETGALETLRHEAIHQLAFNTGLHARVGHQPKWVVEGLATLFEARWTQSGRTSRRERVNAARLRDFREVRKEVRLQEVLGDDALFQTQPLKAYAAAWALTFYLSETRGRAYWAYLAELASRDVRRPLDATERLRLFRKHFGENLPLLESAWLRFMDRL